jgi:hypothetical protein
LSCHLSLLPFRISYGSLVAHFVCLVLKNDLGVRKRTMVAGHHTGALRPQLMETLRQLRYGGHHCSFLCSQNLSSVLFNAFPHRPDPPPPLVVSCLVLTSYAVCLITSSALWLTSCLSCVGARERSGLSVIGPKGPPGRSCLVLSLCLSRLYLVLVYVSSRLFHALAMSPRYLVLSIC